MRIAYIGLVSVLVLLACSGVVFAQNKISGPFYLEKGVVGFMLLIVSPFLNIKQTPFAVAKYQLIKLCKELIKFNDGLKVMVGIRTGDKRARARI